MKKKHDGENNKKELPALLDEFRRALEKEIEAIKKGGQSSTLIYGGQKIQSNPSDFWYSFSIEYMPDLPADTPCKLTVGNEFFDVTVIQVAQSKITISSQVELPDNIGKAKLDNGSTVLMERLIKRIEDNSEKENKAGLRMIPNLDTGKSDECEKIHHYAESDILRSKNNNDKQNLAVDSALNNNITYIWGPPGTGKTTVIKDIILNLLSRERTTLLISHTNTAVDGAIKKIDEACAKNYKENEQYPILRLGNISDLDISHRVKIDSHISQAGFEFKKRREELQVHKNDLEKELAEIERSLLKFNWIESNRIEKCVQIIEKINILKKEKKSALDEIEALTQSSDELKRNFPNYTSFLILSKELKDKRQQLNELKEKAKVAKETAAEADKSIHDAENEIKKLKKEKVLKSQLDTHLPLKLQQENINTLESQITELRDTIDRFTIEISENQSIVDKYDNSNNLFSAFRGKKNADKARLLLKNLADEHKSTAHELSVKQRSYDALCRELIETQSIEEQLELLNASGSIPGWNDEIEQSKQIIETQQSRIMRVSPRIEPLESDISKLMEQVSQLVGPFQEISRISREIKARKKRISELNIDNLQNDLSETLTSEMMTASQILEDECSESAPVKIIEWLNRVLNLAQSNVESLNKGALVSKKGTLMFEVQNIKEELESIERRLDELRKEVILSSKVIGTTLTKAYIDDILQSRMFDTVIVDEASMASIPALWCAASLADANIVIVGDFMQLPPIVIASGDSKDSELAMKWLGQDIFDISGMQSLLRKRGSKVPENFVALTYQYRMEPEIAELANLYYGEYNTKLKSPAYKMLWRCEERDTFYSWYPNFSDKEALHIVDTKNLNAWATGVPRGRGHSRLNYFSASLCVEMAFRFLGDKLNEDGIGVKPSIIIIAPYKPHVARVIELVKFKYRTLGIPENSNFIEVGTVHSFQGKEADIVIFDLVVDEPHWKANIFMSEESVNIGLKKMFNVAITRAKYKLFIVGNIHYFKQRAKNNALSELIQTIEGKGAVMMDAKESYPDLSFSMNIGGQYSAKDIHDYITCTENQFFDCIINDISQCKNQMIIYSPFMTAQRIGTLLPYLVDAVNRGCNIIVVTKTINERGKEKNIYKKIESNLKDNGIQIIYKKCMHEKNVFIDNDYMWTGSLNMLSFTGNTGEFMIRIHSNKIASDSLNEMCCEKLFNAIFRDNETICPICGERLIIAESSEGGFYWSCINCDYTRKNNDLYPHDGILRCEKCGEPFIFDMKNEPRWICEGNARHYKKLKINDLRLEKMYNLLSKDDLKRLEKYFGESENQKVASAWKDLEKYWNNKGDNKVQRQITFDDLLNSDEL